MGLAEKLFLETIISYEDIIVFNLYGKNQLESDLDATDVPDLESAGSAAQ